MGTTREFLGMPLHRKDQSWMRGRRRGGQEKARHFSAIWSHDGPSDQAQDWRALYRTVTAMDDDWASNDLARNVAHQGILETLDAPPSRFYRARPWAPQNRMCKRVWRPMEPKCQSWLERSCVSSRSHWRKRCFVRVNRWNWMRQNPVSWHDPRINDQSHIHRYP